MASEDEVKALATEIADDLTATQVETVPEVRPRKTRAKRAAESPRLVPAEFVAGGVVVGVRHHLERVSKLIRRWEEGDFSTEDMALVLRRISRSIDNDATCWCTEEQLCCPVHGKHKEPHRNCIMR